MKTPRPALRRIAVAFMACILALALLEGVLRLASVFVSSTRQWPASAGKDGPVVLFVGDSHTFGLWVEPDETLPAVAEVLLRTACQKKLYCVNLGRAAAPSWVSVAEAVEAIAALKPTVVVFRGGVNNLFWTRPKDAHWWYDLRIIKLARISIHNIRGGDAKHNSSNVFGVSDRRDQPISPPDASGEFKSGTLMNVPLPPAEELTADLRNDVRTLADATKRANAQLYFIGYLDAKDPHVLASRALERIGGELGITYINMDSLSTAPQTIEHQSEFLYSDGHPRRLGYGMEARRLVRTLIMNPQFSGAAPRDPIEWYQEARTESRPARAGPEVLLDWSKRDAGGVVLTIHSKSRCEGLIMVGRSKRGWRLAEFDIPLDDGDVRAASGMQDLTFTTDSDGSSTVHISNSTLESLAEGAACVALVGKQEKGQTRVGYSRILYIGDGRPAAEQIQLIPEGPKK
ncbi:MAG: SGNH/GDSL hydrolase family protein [Planctomycetes bacterium]|nr:SGNH/GDSL hydrolase family protein [Planctomycetota bacterium]